MSWLRRLLVACLVLLATLSSPLAFAEDTQAPVEKEPQDTPLLLEPATLTIPPLRADMTSTSHGWIDVAYPASVESRVTPLVQDADTFKAELSASFGQTVLDRVEVRIVRSPEDMTALAPTGHPPPRYAVGVAYAPLHLVLISLREPHTAEATDLREVLRHELVHVALYDATQGHHIPLWFNEGLAIHESGEHWSTRMHTLWDATLSKTVLPLSDLDRGFPDNNQQVSIAYAESADFVRFLLRDEDRARFGSLIERVRKGTPFDRALSDAYGENVRNLEYEWHEELDKRFSFWPMLTGSSMLWAVITGVLVIAYAKRRRKAKETLARWAKEEAEEDRERAKLLAAVEQTAPPADGTPVIRSSIPTIQHDGEWHTLH